MERRLRTASAPEELSRVPCTRKTMSPRASLQTARGRGEAATNIGPSPPRVTPSPAPGGTWALADGGLGPRRAAEERADGEGVALAQAQPGDLLGAGGARQRPPCLAAGCRPRRISRDGDSKPPWGQRAPIWTASLPPSHVPSSPAAGLQDRTYPEALGTGVQASVTESLRTSLTRRLVTRPGAAAEGENGVARPHGVAPTLLHPEAGSPRWRGDAPSAPYR